MSFQKFVLTSNDGVELTAYKSMPSSTDSVKGIVQIAHGMAEHALRYTHFADYLNSKGFIVFAHDHRGHGANVKEEKDMGYFADANGWFKVVEDMYVLTKIIKSEFPSLPVFLFGHSMGSLLTRSYICMYPNAVNGVVLSGTAGSPGYVRPIAKLIVFILKILKGKRARVQLLDDMSFGSFNSKIKKPRTKFDWLSTDTINVDKYIADSLCGQLFTVKFFDDLLTGLGFIFRKKNIYSINKNLFMLFVSGEQDPVGDFGKGVKQSVNLYRKSGNKNIDLILYPDFRHEIINEKNKDIVYNDVLIWLNKCI